MHSLYLLSVWFHVLAAVVWIGSMVFLVVVLVPVLRGRPFGDVQVLLLHRVGVQLRRVGWVTLSVLFLTGFTNLALRDIPPAAVLDPGLYAGPWGRALLAKLGMVAVVLGLSAVHDFWVGPRAVALMQTDPASRASRSMRSTARWMGRASLLLSLIVLWLAITLPRGGL